MARLITCGWESGTPAEGIRATTNPTGWSVASSPVRSGSWSLRSTGTSSTLVYGDSGGTPAFTTVLGRNYYMHAWVQFPAAPGPGAAFPLGRIGSGGTAVTASLNEFQQIELRMNNVVMATSAVLNLNTWHLIELRGKIVSGTSDEGQLRVNGTDLGSFVASAGLDTAPPISLGSAFELYFDDFAVNDDQGTSENSWPNLDKLVLLAPTADSAKGAGWTNDQAATTNLFASVGNQPPTGIADTTAGGGTHQIRNATANANSAYDATVPSYTTAGIAADATINAVQAVVCTGAPVTTSAKLGTVGVASNPAGTMANLGTQGTAGAFWGGFAVGTFPDSWKWSFGPREAAPSVVRGTSPVVRINQVTSSTRIAMACFLALYVDYTPAAGTVYNDSRPGTVTAGGTATESASFDDSRTGTITAAGSGVESYTPPAATYNDSATGTITASGTSSEAAAAADTRTGTTTATGAASESSAATDARTGTLTATGTSVESASADDTRTGTLTASGAATETSSAADTATGSITGSGTASENAAHTATATGTITATGAGSDSYETAGRYDDSATGTITATGAGTDSHARNTAAAGTITAAGTAAETAAYSDARTGTITATGSGTDTWTIGYTDAAAGTITAAGTGTDSAAHDDARTDALTASGAGADAHTRTSASTGTADATGTGSDSHARNTAAAGTITATGSGLELYQPAGPQYHDTAVGTASVSGTGSHSAHYSDAQPAAITLTGTATDSYRPPRYTPPATTTVTLLVSQLRITVADRRNHTRAALTAPPPPAVHATSTQPKLTVTATARDPEPAVSVDRLA